MPRPPPAPGRRGDATALQAAWAPAVRTGPRGEGRGGPPARALGWPRPASPAPATSTTCGAPGPSRGQDYGGPGRRTTSNQRAARPAAGVTAVGGDRLAVHEHPGDAGRVPAGRLEGRDPAPNRPHSPRV